MARFDFIGFHETRGPDMLRLNALAGLELEPDRLDNVTVNGDIERAEIRADVRRMAALRDLLIDDVRFYETQRNARA